VVANWKMYPQTLRAAKELVSATKRALTKVAGVKVVVVPPSTFLREVSKGVKNAKVSYGAQHAHFERVGAFTGEVSMQQMRDVGAAYVLVGHSERRAMGESNEETNKQVVAALGAGLKPILCVGEWDRDEDGEYLEGFARQVREGLANVPKNKLKNIIIAYEPVWAIGGEKAPEPHVVHEMVLYIHKILMEPFGKAALTIPVLYGGSVNEESARVMIDEGAVQGLLVGHVSIDAKRFAALLKSLK